MQQLSHRDCKGSISLGLEKKKKLHNYSLVIVGNIRASHEAKWENGA